MATPFLARLSFVALAALLFTLGATSTTRAQTTSAPAQTPAPAQSQPPQKKVWTNDNVGGSHSQQNDASAPAQQNSTSTAPAKPKSKKDPKWYHDQIAKLQAQIPPLDKTIAELQAALDGKTLNEPLHYGGNRIGDWKEQVQQLQTKRQDTLDKITALEDEARHNGVPTNEIP